MALFFFAQTHSENHCIVILGLYIYIKYLFSLYHLNTHSNVSQDDDLERLGDKEGKEEREI